MSDGVMSHGEVLARNGLTGAELADGDLVVRTPIDGSVIARVRQHTSDDVAAAIAGEQTWADGLSACGASSLPAMVGMLGSSRMFRSRASDAPDSSSRPPAVRARQERLKDS